MRVELIHELTEAAKHDSRIVLLTADLGFGVVEEFATSHPDRFFNVGVAEQGMIAVATGLAMGGLTPYCYSIGTFASLRALEFIRNGPVIHNLPVRVIGVGPGFDYSSDGISHFAVDDLAVLRAMPGLLIWAPSRTIDIADGFQRCQSYTGSVYMRVPRREDQYSRSIRVETSRESKEICVICFGDAQFECSTLLLEFERQGIQVDVQVASWISPTDLSGIATTLGRYRLVITVETHLVTGGFGSSLTEEIARQGFPTRVLRMGIEEIPQGELGSRSFLNERFGSSPKRLVNQAIEHLSKYPVDDFSTF